VLSGKYSAGKRPSGTRAADGFRNQFMTDFLKPETLARVDALAPIAADLGLSPARLALAWCLRQPNVASVIVGATRLDQLADDAGAAGVFLPEDAVARLDAICPPA
jgi:aryl-alcohol dehydrogenase-like predicted oxidoreductase